MKRNKKTVKIINTVFFIIAALLMCAYAAAAVTAHNYRRFEGTYVSRSTVKSISDYEYSSYYTEMLEPDRFERKDIVRITKQNGGYEIEYIISSDTDMKSRDWQDGDAVYEESASYTARDSSLLVTADDLYREYHGVISERMAKEGGIIECVEEVTGQTKYIAVYFTQNGICVMDDIYIGFTEGGKQHSVSSWGKRFAYDSEYTLSDMLSAAKEERKYWIEMGSVRICERTGWNIYAVLGAAGGVSAASAALFGTAALIMAVARERKKAAAIGFAVFGAAAAAVLAFSPAQSIEGRYYMADLSGMYVENVIGAILDGSVTVEEVENSYEYIDISRSGNGNYIILLYKSGYIEVIRTGKADWRGRLTFESDGYIRIAVSIVPTWKGIEIKGIYRPAETAYGFDRLGPSGYNIRLGYIILLSFAVCAVVSLTVSVFRNKYRRAHPVICEGGYRVSDILYMDDNIGYMRDYMLGNWRGVAVELKDGTFTVDSRNMGAYEHEPKYEAMLGKLPGLLKLRRGICVKPVLREQRAADSRGEYRMIYDKKRRVLVYSVGEQTLAAFALRPLTAKNCGVGL